MHCLGRLRVWMRRAQLVARGAPSVVVPILDEGEQRLVYSSLVLCQTPAAWCQRRAGRSRFAGEGVATLPHTHPPPATLDGRRLLVADHLRLKPLRGGEVPIQESERSMQVNVASPSLDDIEVPVASTCGGTPQC